jgi:hypothetical protein
MPGLLIYASGCKYNVLNGVEVQVVSEAHTAWQS